MARGAVGPRPAARRSPASGGDPSLDGGDLPTGSADLSGGMRYSFRALPEPC